VSETDVVVFPSPAGVGVTAVTLISFASGRSASRSRTERSTFALYRPYGSISSREQTRVGRDLEDGAERRLLGDLEARGHLRLHGAPFRQ